MSEITVEQQAAFIEMITKARIFFGDQHDTLIAILSTLRSHAELVRDARRYRWLRGEQSTIDSICTRKPISNNGATFLTMLEGEELDAAIDAALPKDLP